MVKWSQSLIQTVSRTKQTLNVCNIWDTNCNISFKRRSYHLGGLVIVGEGCLRYFPFLPACIFTVIFSLQEDSQRLSEINEDLEKAGNTETSQDRGQLIWLGTITYHFWECIVVSKTRQRIVDFVFSFRKFYFFFFFTATFWELKLKERHCNEWGAFITGDWGALKRRPNFHFSVTSEEHNISKFSLNIYFFKFKFQHCSNQEKSRNITFFCKIFWLQEDSKRNRKSQYAMKRLCLQ